MSTAEMPLRALGRTGSMVSAIGLGGSHIGKPDVEAAEAVRLIRSALDRGLTFLDNSWDYNDGESDRRYAKALKDGYRNKAFLMTKVDGRSRKEAARQIDESLRRMETDHVDLLQHHEVIRFEDADRIFAPDGAMQAFLDAKQAGKVRFIGFTGHKDPHIHLHMLRVAAENDFTFDAVQMPLNVMDAHYRSFQSLVLPALIHQGIGVIGMKSMGNGIILRTKAVSAIECLRYALSLPTSVVVTGIAKAEELDQAFEAAGGAEPYTAEQMQELLSRTESYAESGAFELFKTSSLFDATAEHPEWLGEESARSKELVAS